MSDKLNPWIYNAEVKKVIDGDTFDIIIDLGFDTLKKGRVRLYGVNTPESRTSNLEEKKMGLAAKEFTDQWLKSANHKVKIETIIDKNEKYGRVLAKVWNEAGNCLNDDIIASGLARAYFGVGDKTFEEFKKDNDNEKGITLPAFPYGHGRPA
jgi:micrococcal nuclease